jgi:hypothetical protein
VNVLVDKYLHLFLNLASFLTIGVKTIVVESLFALTWSNNQIRKFRGLLSGRAAALSSYTYPILNEKSASWSKIFLLKHIAKIQVFLFVYIF